MNMLSKSSGCTKCGCPSDIAHYDGCPELKEERLIKIVCRCKKFLIIKGKGWKIDAPKGNNWVFTCPCGWEITLPNDVFLSPNKS